MSYATPAEYKQYGGDLIPDEQLEQALELASDDIDILTYSRIIGAGFEHLTPFQQERVKKAVCRHADFRYRYGDFLDVPFSGYGAGSISMSFDKEKNGGGGVKTSDAVLNLLRATGLMDRRLC